MDRGAINLEDALNFGLTQRNIYTSISMMRFLNLQFIRKLNSQNVQRQFRCSNMKTTLFSPLELSFTLEHFPIMKCNCEFYIFPKHFNILSKPSTLRNFSL